MSYPRLTNQRICSDFIYTTSHVKGFLWKGLISWIRKYCVESEHNPKPNGSLPITTGRAVYLPGPELFPACS